MLGLGGYREGTGMESGSGVDTTLSGVGQESACILARSPSSPALATVCCRVKINRPFH